MKKVMFVIVLICVVFSFGIVSGSAEELVFVSIRKGNQQIYKMKTTGADQVNISDNKFIDDFPDVSPDGKKIVFSSMGRRNDPGENVYIMDIDGHNVQRVTSLRGQAIYPKWSPWGFVAFAYPAYYGRVKIWSIKSDGTGLRRVTNPGPNESDDNGHDFFDGGKMIVFSRKNNTTQTWDLYSCYFEGGRNLRRITNTPRISETLPVVSHNGKLLAYRNIYLDPYRETIRIVKIGTWRLVNEIIMRPPADKNISGIDFSRDDNRLFFSIDSSDVPGNLESIKSEIFSVKIDGTDQRRLTRNNVADYWPSSIP